MEKEEISIPVKRDRSIKCPSCKNKKLEVVAGAIEEPCDLPAKCKCGEEFVISFIAL